MSATEYRENYTVREVAQMLACSVQHVHNLIETGRLQAFNIAANPGKRASWRIPRKAIAQISDHAA